MGLMEKFLTLTIPSAGRVYVSGVQPYDVHHRRQGMGKQRTRIEADMADQSHLTEPLISGVILLNGRSRGRPRLEIWGYIDRRIAVAYL